jgi:mono/diheme cytochrome c family protein
MIQMTSIATIKQALVLAAVSTSMTLVVSGCTGGGKGVPDLHSQPNIELVQDMMDQPALKAQDYHPGDVNKPAGLLPPENTVPVGYKPYPYHNDAVGAAANLKNPFSGEMSPEILARGQKKFETYCMVCHGEKALGDGPVAPKMALKPPPLVSEKIIGLKDGGIFHIISDGQGVMSSYAYQLVDEKDRWAVVNYIRSLQALSKK